MFGMLEASHNRSQGRRCGFSLTSLPKYSSCEPYRIGIQLKKPAWWASSVRTSNHCTTVPTSHPCRILDFDLSRSQRQGSDVPRELDFMKWFPVAFLTNCAFIVAESLHRGSTVSSQLIELQTRWKQSLKGVDCETTPSLKPPLRYFRAAIDFSLQKMRVFVCDRLERKSQCFQAPWLPFHPVFLPWSVSFSINLKFPIVQQILPPPSPEKASLNGLSYLHGTACIYNFCIV